MPVRNAMRKIHAHRQEELQQRDEEREAEEFENEMKMTLGIGKNDMWVVGKCSNLTNIFEMGWFNYQLGHEWFPVH